MRDAVRPDDGATGVDELRPGALPVELRCRVVAEHVDAVLERELLACGARDRGGGSVEVVAVHLVHRDEDVEEHVDDEQGEHEEDEPQHLLGEKPRERPGAAASAHAAMALALLQLVGRDGRLAGPARARTPTFRPVGRGGRLAACGLPRAVRFARAERPRLPVRAHRFATSL